MAISVTRKGSTRSWPQLASVATLVCLAPGGAHTVTVRAPTNNPVEAGGIELPIPGAGNLQFSCPPGSGLAYVEVHAGALGLGVSGKYRCMGTPDSTKASAAGQGPSRFQEYDDYLWTNWSHSIAPIRVDRLYVPINGILDGQYAPHDLAGRTLLDCFPRGAPDVERQIRSSELCVSAGDLGVVLNALVDLFRDNLAAGIVFPGAFSVRRCLGTRATRGFTLFPQSCTIELPALNVAGLDDRFIEFVDLLSGTKGGIGGAGVPFTQHPGQLVRLGPRSFSDEMTAANVTPWMEARESLLGNSGAAMFTNRLGPALQIA